MTHQGHRMALTEACWCSRSANARTSEPTNHARKGPPLRSGHTSAHDGTSCHRVLGVAHGQRWLALIGTIHEAIVEGASEEHEWVMKGRLWSQVPEIDGITYFNTTRELVPGQIVHVEITEVKDYDISATVLEEDDPRIAQNIPSEVRKHSDGSRSAA